MHTNTTYIHTYAYTHTQRKAISKRVEMFSLALTHTNKYGGGEEEQRETSIYISYVNTCF